MGVNENGKLRLKTIEMDGLRSVCGWVGGVGVQKIDRVRNIEIREKWKCENISLLPSSQQK